MRSGQEIKSRALWVLGRATRNIQRLLNLIERGLLIRSIPIPAPLTLLRVDHHKNTTFNHHKPDKNPTP